MVVNTPLDSYTYIVLNFANMVTLVQEAFLRANYFYMESFDVKEGKVNIPKWILEFP